MTMKEEYTAIDMATAAADGFRAGQRAAQSAPAGEREAPVVVATAILGGLFHGGSGPELGEIDIEVCTPALEALQCETVNSSYAVFLPLMTVAQHQRIVAALSAQQSAQPEFCCELSYKAAKQKAWNARDLTHCKCDHNEYCEHCWPDDFREGGKWHGGFETKQSAPERVSVPVELLERVCWPVASGSDRHTHSEAVAELRALLASHAEGGKV